MELLAEAFHDSPLFQFAFPDADARREALRNLFRALMDDAIRHGRVEAAYNGKLAGVLIWYPPGAYPMTLSRVMRNFWDYLRIAVANPSGVMTLYRAQKALDRMRPREPHCHAYFLAGRHGEVIGAVLTRRMLDEADRNHWPVYLETQERRALRLYSRLGFGVLRAGVETPRGGPPTWTMWRKPRQ